MKTRQSAFTLLEIMLVVAIIGVLLGAAIYKMSPALDVAKGTTSGGGIQGIRTMLMMYNSKTGYYPTTEQGLKALVVRPTTEPLPSSWVHLMDDVPKDPWGQEYIYRFPGVRNPNSYDLFSAGPDHRPDTADDDWGSN
ncbi:MAG: ral secretion pathway protein [Verrucomicrobiota bacterium]|jgi:general secretion pathway protein G